jgi:hypothetical protein
MTTGMNLVRNGTPSRTRESHRAAFQAWTTPLWSHALPAWCGSARALDLAGHAELVERHDAVRRWRGLPPETE